MKAGPRFGSPPNLHAVSAGYPAVPGGLEVGADEEWRLMMVTPGWDRAGSDASHCRGNVGDPPVRPAGRPGDPRTETMMWNRRKPSSPRSR